MVCIFVEVLKGKLPEIHTKIEYGIWYVYRGSFFLTKRWKYIPKCKNAIWYVGERGFGQRNAASTYQIKKVQFGM